MCLRAGTCAEGSPLRQRTAPGPPRCPFNHPNLFRLHVESIWQRHELLHRRGARPAPSVLPPSPSFPQEADRRILQALLEEEEEAQREHSARREQARADMAWMQRALEQQLQREREQEAELQMLLR